MKRPALGLAFTILLGLACAPTTPRVAVAVTPAKQAPPPPADCGQVKEPYLAELCAMKEPALSVSGPETYRFLFMRHLHNPVAVRFTRKGDGIAVTTVEANVHDPKDNRRHEFTAEIGAWNDLKAHLESADFWNLFGDPTEDERGLDGADWVIEGRRGGVYHAVVRWNPPPGPFRSACEDFIKLAGMAFPTELR
jgi:hypothetical protein